MKNLILLITIMVSGILTQAQTFTEVANKYLAHISFVDQSYSVKTKYGDFVGKANESHDIIVNFIIIVDNKNPLYDTIIKVEKDALHKIGKLFTEYIYYATPVKEKTFKDLDTAIKYYNTYHESEIDAYKKVSIYKNKHKNRYTVGLFTISEDHYLFSSSSNIPFGLINRFEKVK